MGGDYEHARLLLPSVFAICTPVAVIPMTRRYLAAIAIAPWVIAAAFVLRPPHPRFGQGFLVPIRGRVTSNDFGWGPNSANLRKLSTPGLHLQAKLGGIAHLDLPLQPDVRQPVDVSIAIGVSSYASGNNLNVLDLLGLADPLTARLEAPHYTALLPFPGHEKELPEPWTVARLFPASVHVDPETLYTVAFPLIPTTTGRAFDDQVNTARLALQRPALRQLDRDTRAPMSVSRFFGNIVDSFANTRLRVSPDPATAYRTLCGTPRAGPARGHITFLSPVAARPPRTPVTTLDRTAPTRRDPFLNPSADNAGYRHVVADAGFV